MKIACLYNNKYYKLLRTREKILEINDCTETNHPEFLLHHSPKVLQLSHNLLSCQLSSTESSLLGTSNEKMKRMGTKKMRMKETRKKTHLHSKSISEKQ